MICLKIELELAISWQTENNDIGNPGGGWNCAGNKRIDGVGKFNSGENPLVNGPMNTLSDSIKLTQLLVDSLR